MNPRRLIALVGTMMVLMLPLTGPAEAHGAGVVKSCIQGTDCTTNSANNAVFAICNPVSALTSCNPGRAVTIRLSNFDANDTVSVYFLNHEVDFPLANDCSQGVGALGRTHLGDLATSSTGTASLDVTLPPAGGTPSKWSYGPNWICATTDPTNSGTGTIGDQLFMIYPA